MPISDIVVIALLALFGVFGVLIAVKKSALSLGAFLVAFVASFFLAKVIAEALLGIDGIRQFVMGGDGWSLYTWIYGGLPETTAVLNPDGTPTNLFSNYYTPVIDIITPFTGYTENFSPDQGLALYYAFLMFSAIVGVALFIVIRLLLMIVTAIIKSFIGKRKSGVGRLFGLIFGMVQGFAVALVLLITYSTMGGLTFVSAFNTISDDIESKSVITKTLNDWSYAIRNGVYLPDIDMYGRIVDKSGFTVRQEDIDEDTNTKLLGEDLAMYNNFSNLNYDNGDPYGYDATLNEGTKPADKTQGMIDYTQFSESGFDRIVKAIMDYNEAAAQKIEDAGMLVKLGLDPQTITVYNNAIQTGANSIRVIWRSGSAVNNTQPLLTMLSNYEVYIADNKNLTTESLITAANAELSSRYDNIMAAFNSLKSQYIVLKDVFGTIDWDGLLPEGPYEIPVPAVE